jgi:hypothetical protein
MAPNRQIGRGIADIIISLSAKPVFKRFEFGEAFQVYLIRAHDSSGKETEMSRNLPGKSNMTRGSENQFAPTLAFLPQVAYDRIIVG